MIVADEAALTHLRAADAVLGSLIDAVAEPLTSNRADRPPPGQHYAALVRAIVGQQVSVAAARSIWNRLLAQFDGHPPTPAQVLASDPEELRAAAGLSRAKAGYLRSLAEHIESGELDIDHIGEHDDDAVIAELTAVKGIGEWSAHMFLMFQLGRPDVLASGDLGVRRAIERAYGLDALPTPTEVIALAEPWRPHRSTACLYLWNSLANAPQ